MVIGRENQAIGSSFQGFKEFGLLSFDLEKMCDLYQCFASRLELLSKFYKENLAKFSFIFVAEIWQHLGSSVSWHKQRDPHQNLAKFHVRCAIVHR